MDKIILLTKLNGTGYIFDVDDYVWLRQKYRIVGSLIGTRDIQRLAFNEKTFPVELSKWETQLLLDLKIAILISKEESFYNLPYKQKHDQRENLNIRLKDQNAKLKEEKLGKTERSFAQIMSKNQGKLLKSETQDKDKLNATDLLKKVEENFKFDINNALLEIPLSCVEFHTGKPTDFSTDDLFKYALFRDCWSRGKFVTSGETFGADFLVYSGDPMIYHASHTLIISNKKSNPLRLIGKVRTSVTVNKICVFAVKAENQSTQINYQTLIWEGSRANENAVRNVNVKKLIQFQSNEH